MNEKVLTSPVKMGFAPLDTNSANFKSAERWKIFGEALSELIGDSRLTLCHTEDGKDWARKNFNNKKALRRAQTYEFISNQ